MKNSSDVVFVDKYFLSVSSIDFSGHYSKSENGQYILAWSDGYIFENEEDGTEKWQTGSYVLLEKEKVILQGELERPDNGQVANNGIFIIADYFFNDDLESSLVAFSKSGQKLISHHFLANLSSSCMSNNGKYAICQLYNSETADANTIVFFDLETGKLLWQKIPETWVADFFELDCENKILYLGYKHENNVKFRYSFDGVFLDTDAWYQFRIQNGSGFEILEIAEEKKKQINLPIDKKTSKEILELYSLASERLKDYPHFRAQAYRKIGEEYESFGDIENAIKNYELALSFNPKVGVKMKLKKLIAKL